MSRISFVHLLLRTSLVKLLVLARLVTRAALHSELLCLDNLAPVNNVPRSRTVVVAWGRSWRAVWRPTADTGLCHRPSTPRGLIRRLTVVFEGGCAANGAPEYCTVCMSPPRFGAERRRQMIQDRAFASRRDLASVTPHVCTGAPEIGELGGGWGWQRKK